MCSTPCCRTLRAGDCVSRVFRRLIQRGCGSLGRTAALLPCLFLSLGLLVLFAGVPGLFLLEGDVDLVVEETLGTTKPGKTSGVEIALHVRMH